MFISSSLLHWTRTPLAQRHDHSLPESHTHREHLIHIMLSLAHYPKPHHNLIVTLSLKPHLKNAFKLVGTRMLVPISIVNIN